jgi:hypothetical protein
MKKLVLSIAVALLLCVCNPTFGQIDQCKGSLQGIQSIGVAIGDAPPTHNVGFLPQIKTDVELKLKMAGINVIDLDTLAKPENKKKFFETSGFLEINVFISELDKTGKQPGEAVMIYTIQLMLRQRIELSRNHVKCLSPTWVEGTYNITCLPSQLEDKTRKSVQDLVAIFVRAYTAENPLPAGKS